MKNIIILLVAMFLIIAGCTKDTLLEPSNELIVVRGYIYAGEPVADIQITTTLALGSEAQTAPPVNNAAVSLIKNNQTYSLVPSAGDSGYYYYPGDDLVVESGDIFEIQVEYAGNVTTGKTVVPFPPENVAISSNELIIPETFFRGMEDSTSEITITWQEDAASLFYVVMENLEANPEEITSFGGGPSNEMRRRLVFPPTNNNEFRIRRFSVSYYGNHQVKIYRVNQEYADLYQSRNQDSRDLNEPLTNIENGLGVFSAFASQSANFKVISE